ncbi:Helix-turn-helix [Pseudoxanthomonas sp. CF385]|uniref:helix-turn-helix domain-containing protein n=1 Tax=Pseudoxanthomonas sp. CF385 TaxID=1881042 RepID=UPI00088A80CD|nr:helix-turn-helix domain-containing protein [Pseudoxanthomonas sp. CF385]SDQ66461.1 Helix-turn-helix [Pseudoxanthomonas sp. CF385]
MTTIAMRIRRARALARLSQSQLAHFVGVNRSAVAQWEREAGTRPSVEHLAAVAIATKTPFEWLATGRGGPATLMDAASPSVEYAMDDVEARVLEAVRHLPARKRVAICKLLEELASQP